MNKRRPLWFTRVGVLALALSVFAACSDSTSPEDVDTEQAAAAVDGIVAQFFTDNEAAQSLGVFDDLISGALAGANVAIFDLLPFPASGGIQGLGRSVQLSVESAKRMQRTGPSASIPVGALGVWIYNPATQQYEIDPGQTAPANTARFILYAVDPILDQPVLDAQGQPTEIGYIDIIDTSTFPTVNVGMRAVVSGATLIDVDVTGTFDAAALDLSFSGSLSDGTETLAFSMNVLGSETSAEANFELSYGGYTIDFGFSFTADGAGSFDASISDGTDTIRFTLSVDALGIAEGGVFFNGDQVAIISGNLDNNPTVTNADGDPLTEAQLADLAGLFEGVGEMFELFGSLLEFGLFLLVLGTI